MVIAAIYLGSPQGAAEAIVYPMVLLYHQLEGMCAAQGWRAISASKSWDRALNVAGTAIAQAYEAEDARLTRFPPSRFCGQRAIWSARHVSITS